VEQLTKFSANLGFLWTELLLPDAVRAAHKAGFHAVECHWPYTTSVNDLNAAIAETGLEMLGLNTSRGNTEVGENGLSALPNRQFDARAAIDEAIAYATATNIANIHVMAGFARRPDAHKIFVENLRYATSQAAPQNITILIEPLNRHDAPNYFLQTTNQAISIIKEVAALNLKLMFDCYHVGRTEGDVTTRIRALLPHIGHIQFASVPDRGAPDHGELNYKHIFQDITNIGYKAPLGAEYKPNGPTKDTLDWMKLL
jgi:2-dehydrotetronate isomerase